MFLLSGFIITIKYNCAKRSHKAAYQLNKSTQDFPKYLWVDSPWKGQSLLHMTNSEQKTLELDTILNI